MSAAAAGLQHAACWLALALGLAGCASMEPPYAEPLLPIAATYPGDAPGRAASIEQSAAAVGWRDYFADPHLQALVGQALENNRDLRLALLRVQEAGAAYGIQRAERFPTLSLGASAARSRTPADLNLTRQPLTASQYQAGLGLNSWELDFWGRVRSLNDAALQNYLATDAASRAVSVSLIAQVANGYLGLRELDERLELANQTIASRAESLRIFRRRVEVGSTSRLDLTQVESLWQQARTLGAQLAQARAVQAHALAVLVGAAVEISPMPERLADAGVLRELSIGLPSSLLSDRPDIVAAEHQLRAANASIGAARAAFFPRIALVGSLGTASAELEGLFSAGSRAWSFAPSISLPIFDGGRNRSNLALAEVRKNQAIAQYERVIQGAFRDVSDALSARQWLGDQVQTLQATLVVQTERSRLAKLRYDNGATTFLEVLDAQRDLLTAQQQLVQTRRLLLSSRINLYAALGGGTQPQTVDGAVSANEKQSTKRPP